MDERINKVSRAAWEALGRWAGFAERYWWDAPDRDDLGGFGTGYDNWGVQTNQKYLAAMAVLAMLPEAAEHLKGCTQPLALERALRALRFSLASHKSGDYQCADGRKWGHTWISALGIERMMHAVYLLEPRMSDDDRDALRRVLTSEADWIHNRYTKHGHTGVCAHLWDGNHTNVPESNLWNGALLWRTAMMYPDHAEAGAWRQRAHEFLMNAVSVPADADDRRIVAGRPVRDWHVGANFFDHYALDHHGYLNVGYMVICLSNAAMLHFDMKSIGQAPPESLYHHQKDLWRTVRRFVFADGRLARIGGDTRQRYCYCQDYLLPALVLAAEHWQDSQALGLLAGAVDLIRQEQSGNSDGGFLSSRLAHLAEASPYYYTRLESDKAAALSMTVCWLRDLQAPVREAETDFEACVAGGWEEPQHGAVFHRSATRLASWSWRAAHHRVQGLCLPPRSGHLAEWEDNLSGEILTQGAGGDRKVRACLLHSFDGGFVTMGEITEGIDAYIQEGWQSDECARHYIVAAALPDAHTMVRMEWAVSSPRRVYLTSVLGVKLEVPNDLFNQHVRRYASGSGDRRVASHTGPGRKLIDFRSSWVNVDDQIGLIGVYGADGWRLLQRGHRIGGAFGSLFTDTLCWQFRQGMWDVWGPAVILDNACVILSSTDAGQTRRLHASNAAQRLDCRHDDGRDDVSRAVLVRGRDNRQYLLVANFSGSRGSIRVDAEPVQWRDLVTGQPADPGGAGVWLDAHTTTLLAHRPSPARQRR